jgi:hypothetical protein
MYLYLIAAIFVLFLMMQNKTRGMNKAIEKLVRQSEKCPEFVGEVDIYLAQIGGEAST